MSADYYKQLLEPMYRGRKWIVVSDSAAGATAFVQRILDAGADSVMVVAGTTGTGPQPSGVELFVVGTIGATIMGGIRAFADAIISPSEEMCAAITAFDPAQQASVLTSYLIPAADLCGRPVYGGARPAWKALEDKIVIDELWRRAGVPTAPSRIVGSQDVAAVRSAVAELSIDGSAVVVADNAEGWHGGAEYTRYLAPDRDWSEALAFFAEHAHRVRVMQFLQGVPCSIHGLVAQQQVLAFRPVEMLVYRQPGSSRFVYAGMATLWDPPIHVRQEMRQIVRQVGSLIRDEVGYRGAFGIDGVLTSDGFRPTELNPRLTGGLGLQTQTAGDYPIGDINRVIIAGEAVDLRLDDLEKEVVSGADRTRTGRWSRPVSHVSMTETTERSIVFDGNSWEPTDGDEATATVMLGPSPQGALVAVKLSDDHGLPAGDPTAGIAAASFSLADELWDTRIGPLVVGTSGPV